MDKSLFENKKKGNSLLMNVTSQECLNPSPQVKIKHSEHSNKILNSSKRSGPRSKSRTLWHKKISGFNSLASPS